LVYEDKANTNGVTRMAQGVRPIQYDSEKASNGVTALGGVPI